MAIRRKDNKFNQALTAIGQNLPGPFKATPPAPEAPLPPPRPQPASTPPQQIPSQTEGKAKVFQDQKGNLSGITTREGKTFLGLNPQDVQKINAAEISKQTPPEGTLTYPQANALEARELAAVQALQQIASGPTPEQIMQKQQFLEGNSMIEKANVAASVGTGALTASGLGAGAAALGIGTAGVGVAVGAGIAAGYYALRNVEKNDIKTASAAFTGSKTGFKFVLAKANAGTDPVQLAELYNGYKADLYASERILKDKLSTSNQLLNADSREEYYRVQQYLGQLPVIEAMIQQAIISPDQNKAILYEQQIAAGNNEL